MFQKFKTATRQFLTAVVLLAIVVLALELFLQTRLPRSGNTVAVTASSDSQSLLVPSSTTHHEMVRLRPESQEGFATNSYGLRGAEPLEKKESLRIVVLGDDTVVGPTLREEETLPTRLQQFLSKATGRPVEVINAGVPGYCPLLSWIQYQQQLRRLQADIVILHVDMSDVSDDGAYRPFLNSSGSQPVCSNGLLSAKEKPWPLELLQESAIARCILRESSNLSQGSTPTDLPELYQWTLKDAPDLRLAIQHAMSPIQLLLEDVKSDGGKLLVAATPVPWQIPTVAETGRTGSLAPFEILKLICRNSGITFCNTATAFTEFQEASKLYAANSAQLSPYGAALYAKQIARALLSSHETASLFSAASRVSRQPSVLR